MAIQVMVPRFFIASTKPEAALDRPKAGSLGDGEGWLRRRVIAGQKRGVHCLEGH